MLLLVVRMRFVRNSDWAFNFCRCNFCNSVLFFLRFSCWLFLSRGAFFSRSLNGDRAYLLKRLPYQQLNNVNYKTDVRNVNCTSHKIVDSIRFKMKTRCDFCCWKIGAYSVQSRFLWFIIQWHVEERRSHGSDHVNFSLRAIPYKLLTLAPNDGDHKQFNKNRLNCVWHKNIEAPRK